MKESKKTLNYPLTRANVAQKAVETIRALEAEGYNPIEVFLMGKAILCTSAEGGPSAKVYED